MDITGIIDELETEAAERSAKASAVEEEFIESLQTQEQIELWNRCKDSLHAERFWKSRTGRRIAKELMQEILAAQNEWLLSDNPRHDKVMELHKRAQAAHLALFMMDKLIADSREAAEQLERIAAEMGE